MYENNGYTNYEFTQNNAGNGGNGYYPYASAPAPEKKREKKQRKGAKTVALVLACSLLSGCVGAAAVNAFNGTGSDSTTLVESSRKPVTVDVAYRNSDREMTAAEVYAANVNSTVGITTSVITTNFFGMRTSGAAAGSGFIISEDGYIVTNYHVVEDSTSIKVTTYDGASYDATLVGYDESNDVAVLKIDAKGLTPVTMGSSEDLNVGDEVVAIGNPLGELTFSLTKGNVSAKDRTVTLSGNVTMKLIQTDAAINSGNSGGALFNMYGEVVGITNAKYSSSSSSSEASIDNIGFAIPLDSVKDIITSIIEKGYAVKPYIGVQLTDAADAALIYSVVKGSPAEEAGLQANDIVTAANGEKVTCADDLTAIVKAMEPGDKLTLTVSRGGQETELKVTVGEQAGTAQNSGEASGRQSGGQPSGNDGEGNGNDGYGYYYYGDGSDSMEDFGSFFGFPFGGSEYYNG
ncbi:MAG: trypsin-like peptidase domain-containing protein [Clostridia bacterium]|nr:trypsin-like peptidase domain-containing protein [Clostridia bacterium]